MVTCEWNTADLLPALIRAHRLITQRFGETTQPDLSPLQMGALIILSSNKEMRLSELRGFLQMPKQQMSKVAGILEQKGLASRRQDREDRRLTYIAITPEGEKAMDELNRHQHEMMERFLSLLESPHKERFVDSLQMIKDALQSIPSI